MYEKALRYSDQSITLTSNSDWTGSCIVQMPSAPHVTHKNVRHRSTYGDDDYYDPNGEFYGEDEDDEDEDDDDDDDEEEDEDEEEEEEEEEDTILQDRINQINADEDGNGDGDENERNEDDNWTDSSDGFDGRLIQYLVPPYIGQRCLRPLFPPGFAGPATVLGHKMNDDNDNNEDNMGNRQEDDVIMGENEIEMKDRRGGDEIEVEIRLKNNGDDKSENDDLNENKKEKYTDEEKGVSCDEHDSGQTKEITMNHNIHCTQQSALSTPISTSSSSNQHIAQPLQFDIMSKDYHKEEKKFCNEKFQKSVSRTLSPYFTECDVDHNYSNMREGEETILESANDKLFINTGTKNEKNGKNAFNKIEQDEGEGEKVCWVGEGKDEKMEDCLEWLQKREEVMEREIAISIISAIQRHVVEDSMTELSLACLSNLIATELQVS